MASWVTTKQQECGIALGGIGTGTVELFPDGEFHQWQIANAPRWASRCNEKQVDDGEGSVGALSFWVRTETENGPVTVRKLGMKTAPEDFTYRLFPWNKPVERIRFDGRFPVCDLDYEDAALPARIGMRAVAPFVPHHTDDSATPGFYIDFTLQNPTDKPVTVSLLSTLEPSFCNKGGCENERYRDGETTGVILRPAGKSGETEGPEEADRGTLCLSAEGGDVTCVTAEHFRFIREYIAYSDYGVSQESVLFGFREKGFITDSEAGCPPDTIPEELSGLTDAEIDRMISRLETYPFARSLLDRIRGRLPAFPSTREEKETFLNDCRSDISDMGASFGSCAICSRVTLAPGKSSAVRFVLSWFFPNHFSETGKRLGHWYENRFSDAREVNRYLVAHRADIRDRAEAFASLLYRTDLPSYYPDSWSGHLSTVVKDSWYIKDGKFGLWEGLGFCGFHTTDITYHASFGLLALFPDLQIRQMRMGAAFQREDGRVHHFFTPDLYHVDNGFDRVDMNPQFVLMVCRDYLYTGDRGYLEDMWEPVKKAMDSSLLLDSDGDGLPDRDTKRNTYDAWDLSGTPAYICVLWLSALNAASRIAEIVGDEARRTQWESLLSKGLASLEDRLWNGRYYDLWKTDTETGTVYDGSLMTDQIDGEWFLRASGIGSNLPDGRVRDILSAIEKNNYTRDGGILNCSFPDDCPVSLRTWHNCQADANWTGIGYVIAALAISAGMRDFADAVVGTIHENQARLGKFWEHWECGFRYTRPLSSWTTMTAASGLSVDAANRVIRFRPCQEELTVPFCACGLLGTAEFTAKTCTLRLIEGAPDNWKVDLPEGTELRVLHV